MDAALDGSLTAEKLSKLLPAASAAAAVGEYAKGLAVRAETVLLGQFHREIDNGAADFVLGSMRKNFDKHAAEIAKARGLFSSESSPEHVLNSGETAVMKAWQELPEHIVAVSKIAAVAREFGPRLGNFPMITEYHLADNFRISDTGLMCCGGTIWPWTARRSWFPDGPHRASAFFRVPLKLNTIAEAKARYAEPCGGRVRPGRVRAAGRSPNRRRYTQTRPRRIPYREMAMLDMADKRSKPGRQALVLE